MNALTDLRPAARAAPRPPGLGASTRLAIRLAWRQLRSEKARLASAIGTLESEGLMRDMTQRLADDPDLRARYEAAARDYVARRDAHEVLDGVPAQGGMPVRVKCLHVLVAHSLAVGPGVNPFGDEALERLGDWAARGPCVDPDDETAVVGKRTRS